jgi:hypothetical protein
LRVKGRPKRLDRLVRNCRSVALAQICSTDGLREATGACNDDLARQYSRVVKDDLRTAQATLWWADLRKRERMGSVVYRSGSIKSTCGKDLCKKAYRIQSIVLGKRRCMLYGLVVDSAKFSSSHRIMGQQMYVARTTRGKDRRTFEKKGNRFKMEQPPTCPGLLQDRASVTILIRSNLAISEQGQNAKRELVRDPYENCGVTLGKSCSWATIHTTKSFFPKRHVRSLISLLRCSALCRFCIPIATNQTA